MQENEKHPLWKNTSNCLSNTCRVYLALSTNHWWRKTLGIWKTTLIDVNSIIPCIEKWLLTYKSIIKNLYISQDEFFFHFFYKDEFIMYKNFYNDIFPYTFSPLLTCYCFVLPGNWSVLDPGQWSAGHHPPLRWERPSSLSTEPHQGGEGGWGVGHPV